MVEKIYKQIGIRFDSDDNISWYEDVGRMVHNNGKLRCCKIEILD